MTDRIRFFRGDYRFLSNFWPAPVMLDGVEYPTVEHAYQAAKVTDTRLRRIIQACERPGAAKYAGRKVQLRPDWDRIKVGMMRDLVTQKFSREPLRSQLLLTGSAILEEGNHWNDTFWGICNGEGHNMLGRILMEVRSGLHKANSKSA
jgi:ribA/ribD-fused uncharacterized protein